MDAKSSMFPSGTGHEPVEPPQYPTPEQYRALSLQGSSTLPGSTDTAPPTQSFGRSLPWLVTLGGIALKLLPFASILVSIWAFGFASGSWAFGLGIVGLLFVHEMGHFIMLRLKGMPAKWPVFIPFLGAYVSMPQSPASAGDMAEIALAGPLLGGIGAAVSYLAYELGWPSFWLSLAYIGFLLNLFNLFPINPLDGGRVVGAISRWIWPLGIIAAAVLLVVHFNALLLLLLGLGLFETVSSFRAPRDSAYYTVAPATRVGMTIAYVALIVMLAGGFMLTSGMLATLRQSL